MSEERGMGDEAWGMGSAWSDGVSEPGGIRSYEDLRVWQAGIALAERAYLVTKTFPDSERFGLTTQLRRAAVSVPSNIAEGYGRGTRLDYLRFLRIARGSLFEIQTQILIAHRVGLISSVVLEETRLETDALRRQLIALIASVERHTSA